MKDKDGFMATSRRLRRLVDRKISAPGWRSWLANVPLLAVTMGLLILVVSTLAGLLPGPQDLRSVVAGFGGFFSYHAAFVVVGWLHVKRVRWTMRSAWRKK